MKVTGRTIRAIRKKKRMDLSTLARITGMSRAYLTNVELVNSNISVKSLKKVLKALNHTIEIIPCQGEE